MKAVHGVVAGLMLLVRLRATSSVCSDGTEGVDGNGVVCCTTGCEVCGGPDCTTAGAAAGLGPGDCCGGTIKKSGVYCDVSNEAPCIIGSPPAATTCSDGTPGVDGNGVICCTPGCEFCGGPGCTTAGAAAGLGPGDCCGGTIKKSGVYCDVSNEAPCIIGSSATEECSDGTPGVDGNGAVCCTPGCEFCGGPGCTTAGASAGLGPGDCCGGTIKKSGVYCDVSNEAPCIIRDGTPTGSVCSDGTEGVDGNGVVCCTPGCEFCGGPGCNTIGAAVGLGSGDCCGTRIKMSGVYCDVSNEAPCIIGSAPAPTPAPTTSTSFTSAPTSAPV